MRPNLSLTYLSVVCAGCFAIIGVLPWVPFGFVELPLYPGDFHRTTMAYGFGAVLLLATWLDGVSLSKRFLIIIILLFSIQLTSLVWGQRILSVIVFSLVMCAALWADLERCRRLSPFSVMRWMIFVMVLFGLVLACLGSSLQPSWSRVAHNLGFKGILIFALFSCVDRVRWILYRKPMSEQSWLPLIGLGVVLLGSLLEGFDLGGFHRWCYPVGCLSLGIYFLPHSLRGAPLWTWLAGCCCILGLFLMALFPDFEIHLMHLFYVSGVGVLVLTLPVTSDLEKRLIKPIAWASGLIMVAGLTRSTAIFLSGSYERHLAYASILWIVSLGIWLRWVFPKICTYG